MFLMRFKKKISCLFSACREGMFQCRDCNCVEGRMRCDGVPQCEDSSDELLSNFLTEAVVP
jgi:hypothetical protein